MSLTRNDLLAIASGQTINRQPAVTSTSKTGSKPTKPTVGKTNNKYVTEEFYRTILFKMNDDGESHTVFVDGRASSAVRTAPLYRQTPQGFVRFGWCCEAFDNEFKTWFTVSVGTSVSEMRQSAETVLKNPRFEFKCQLREREEAEVNAVILKELTEREGISSKDALELLERNNADKKLKGVPTLLECLHAHRRAKVEERAARELELKKPLNVNDVEDPEIAELLKAALS